MCNLYRMTKAEAEVARLFRVENAAQGSNRGELVFPGQQGLVVLEGKLRTMTWGFPLVLKGKHGQPLKPKPVNNARTDKLESGFWRNAMTSRRCLVPLTAYAEAIGELGCKTRAWFHLPDAAHTREGVAAAAGLWRPTAEWGDAYAMVITEACDAVRDVHDRMPVLLCPDEWDAWLTGELPAAEALCRPWPHAIGAERTQESWAGR
ncbi:MAG TPA: SOS response-associated peptidase family protein [Croceibacterium sp.]|nr:SOS response-associated peptidase family protein [Croceibacterium sp.]